jgi:thioredoxin reductase (NADPH)
VLATGVSYRRLLASGVDELVGKGVFYSPAVTEAAAMTNQPVGVVGGGNSAGQAAMHLSKYASTVTLLVRSSSLAASMSEYLIRELEAATNVTIRYRCEVAEAVGDEHLERITVRDTTNGVQEPLECAGLFVLIGSQPRTAASLPGVFAAGDVRGGSIKRVASAVGEGAIVINQVLQYLENAGRT